MKKAIGAGIAVLAVAGAAAPYLSGMRAETAFRDNLEAISQNPQLDLELVRYERSWLGAEARSELSLVTPDETIRLGLHHRIHHGPTPVTLALAEVVTTPEIPAEHREAFAHYFGDKAPLTVNLRIGLSGAQHVTFASPPYAGPSLNSPETRIDWQGLTGEAEITRAGDRATFHLEAPGLDLTGKEANLTLNHLAIDSAFRKDSEDLWLGKTEVAVEEARLEAPALEAGDGERLTIEGLRARQRIEREEAGDLLRVKGGWELDRATYGERSLRSAVLALELRHLDAGAYRKLNRRLRDLHRQGLSPEEIRSRTAALLEELLPRFLEHSPELAVTDLAFQAPQGDFQGSARARFQAGDRAPDDLLAQPALVLQQVTAQAEARVAQALLRSLLQAMAADKAAEMLGPQASGEQVEQAASRMVETQIGMARALGFLQADGDHFTAEAEWDQGRVTINGKPLGLGLGTGAGGPMPPGMP